MTESRVIRKKDLLAQMEAGWNSLQAYLGTLSEAQLTQAADAAGWTIKDHIMNLAVWEDGAWAMLEKIPCHKQMGISDEAWKYGDTDSINAIIQQRYRNEPLAKVLQTFKDIHRRLVEKVKSLPEADLQRPYRDFQADSDDNRPIINWIRGNTYEHYAEHRPWIEAIARR